MDSFRSGSQCVQGEPGLAVACGNHRRRPDPVNRHKAKAKEFLITLSTGPAFSGGDQDTLPHCAAPGPPAARGISSSVG